MSNQTDPLQVLNNYYLVMGSSPGKWNKQVEYRLSVNEFTDHKDLFGFMTSEPDIHNFLTVDTKEV